MLRLKRSVIVTIIVYHALRVGSVPQLGSLRMLRVAKNHFGGHPQADSLSQLIEARAELHDHPHRHL